MASVAEMTPPSNPTSAPRGSSVECESTPLYIMDSDHAVFKHFKVAVGVDNALTASKSARDGVKAVYEDKQKARDNKRSAERSAVAAVSNSAGAPKKSRMTDFYGDESTCAKKEADDSICLLFAALRLPEHHADHPLWRNAVSCIARAGGSYTPPKRRFIGGAGLRNCRQRIEVALAPIAASWRRNGVTIASDMMTDASGRPQANVLLINDSGAVFTEAVDTQMEVKTGGYIAGMLRPIIQKVGAENVVALCMDGGSNYAAACRELMVEFPHLEQVPCATHVLDLLMEDIGKMNWARVVVTRAAEIKNFVRSHHFTRGYLRSPLVNDGKGKQVLKPAGTRFGTQFIAVSRLVELRMSLLQMVLSEEWRPWATGGRRASAEVFHGYILDSEWWKVAEFFTVLMEAPFKVMCATDGTAKGMMGRLYDLMLQLTEDVHDILEAKGDEFLTRGEMGEIRKIVKARWDEGLACPMHVVGRILNPANQEEGIFRNDVECTRVLKAYISKHYDDVTITSKDGEERRASLVLQEGLTAFLNLEGSFGMPAAIADREAVKAGTHTALQWWEWHVTDYPHLATLACRSLTQPVSASSCERNWAVWDGLYTAKRNRLGSEKCRDLVYVAHNWKVVHNWYTVPEGQGVVTGNIEAPPLPEGYKVAEEGWEEEADQGEDVIMNDEYE
ncbi:unnamed protein product [Closterium sp. Naga37s-1]|nr:unnamed protein product [Closterium sp. Naga37s-1]